MTTYPDYLDFDLELTPGAAGGSYVARVLSSPRGEAEASISLPFDDDRLENVILKLGRTRSGVRKLGSPQQSLAKTFGAQLYASVFAGEVGTCFRRSLDEADRQGKGLRLRLRLSDAPGLSNVPWEYLFPEGIGHFLVLSAQTPLVRYIDLPREVSPLAVVPPLRVLLVVSAPSDLAVLDTAQEVANLESAFASLAERGLVSLDVLERPTLSALRKALRSSTYHVLHFIGHGGYDDANTDGVLAFEDDTGRSHKVSGGDLGTMLHDHRTLRLAVLNACEGARTSPQDPFSGVAQSLVLQGLPAVVAMQFEITDDAAIALAQEFYSALSDGYPVDAALAEGRKAVFGNDNDVEWGTPVLYLRAKDGRIFDVTATGLIPPVRAPAPPGTTAVVPAAAPAESEASPPGPSRTEGATTPPQGSTTDTSSEPDETEPSGAGERAAFAAAAVVVESTTPAATTPPPAVVHPEPPVEPVRSEPSAPPVEPAAAAQQPPLVQPAPAAPPVQPAQPAQPVWSPLPPELSPRGTGGPPSVPAGPTPTYVPVQPPKKPPKGRGGPALAIVAIIACLAVGLGVWGAVANMGSTGLDGANNPPETEFPEPADHSTDELTVDDSVDLVAVRGTPTIDGLPDDWPNDPVIDASAMVAGRVNPAFTGQWRVQWDEDNLYLAALVFDPVLTQTHQDDVGQLWQGDSANFELGPDAGGRDPEKGARRSDAHFLFGPTPGGVVVNGVNHGPNFASGTSDPSIHAAMTLVGGQGYFIEIALPWTSTGIGSVQENTVVSLNLNMSDADPSTGNFATMVSSNSNRSAENQKHPGLWQRLQLRSE